MRTSSIIRLAVVTVVAAFALPAPAATSSIEIGSVAPAMELVAADGSQRSLAVNDGPKVLIFYRGLW